MAKAAIPAWKEDWQDTRKHYCDWWARRGPILTIGGLPPLDPPRPNAPEPPPPENLRQRHLDPEWFARQQRAELARQPLPADNLPIAHVDLGCVQLAACFGSEPEFAETTVWYNECIDDPESVPPLVLTKNEPWYQTYRRVMLEVLRRSNGDFLVGMPAFGSNLDVLAELRGTQNLLFDLIDRPDWVKQKLEEINQSFFIAFDDYYENIALPDGSSAYTFFHLWGNGKVSQVQCDFAAMISPDMFAEFVVPSLQRQCAWLDRSLFHLDGPDCICHLDHLLSIPELDAVQWTPGAGQPGAGDPTWYDLYRRILDAGKCAQVLGVTADEARHVFETFGSAGVYVTAYVEDEAEAEGLTRFVNDLRQSESA